MLIILKRSHLRTIFTVAPYRTSIVTIVIFIKYNFSLLILFQQY